MTRRASQCTPLGAGHSGLHSDFQTSLHYIARPSSSRTYKFLKPGDGDEHSRNTSHEILIVLYTSKKSKVICLNQQFLKLRFPSQFVVFKAQVSQYERLRYVSMYFHVYYVLLALPTVTSSPFQNSCGRGQR